MDDLLAAQILPHVSLCNVGRSIAAVDKYVIPGLVTTRLGHVRFVPLSGCAALLIPGNHHAPVPIALVLDELADLEFEYAGQVTQSVITIV